MKSPSVGDDDPNDYFCRAFRKVTMIGEFDG